VYFENWAKRHNLLEILVKFHLVLVECFVLLAGFSFEVSGNAEQNFQTG